METLPLDSNLITYGNFYAAVNGYMGRHINLTNKCMFLYMILPPFRAQIGGEKCRLYTEKNGMPLIKLQFLQIPTVLHYVTLSANYVKFKMAQNNDMKYYLILNLSRL